MTDDIDARAREIDRRRTLARHHFSRAKEIMRMRAGGRDWNKWGARSALQSALYHRAVARVLEEGGAS